MTRFSLLAVVVALALSGCTHTRTFNLMDQASISKINSLGAQKEATVRVAAHPHTAIVGSRVMAIDYYPVKVSNLRVSPDSTSWWNVEAGRFETVATAQINEIRYLQRKDHVLGAFEGFGVGLLIGAGIVFAGSDLTAFIGPEYFVGPTGLLGLMMGAVDGSDIVYRFEPPGPPPMVAEDVQQETPR